MRPVILTCILTEYTNLQVTLATFATYILVSPDNLLDAKKAFVALALFNILRLPINLMSQTISLLVQVNTAVPR